MQTVVKMWPCCTPPLCAHLLLIPIFIFSNALRAVIDRDMCIWRLGPRKCHPTLGEVCTQFLYLLKHPRNKFFFCFWYVRFSGLPHPLFVKRRPLHLPSPAPQTHNSRHPLWHLAERFVFNFGGCSLVCVCLWSWVVSGIVFLGENNFPGMGCLLSQQVR